MTVTFRLPETWIKFGPSVRTPNLSDGLDSEPEGSCPRHVDQGVDPPQ